MVFRVTPNHFASNAVRWSQLHTSNLSVFQSQISTGLRVQKPSDDPSAMGSLLANKASLKRLEVDKTNIAAARAKLDQSVAQLISAREAISRANSLALEAVQATEDDRATLAAQVNSVLDLIIEVANSSDGGKPLYAGTSDTLSPFTTIRDPQTGDISAVKYNGTEDRARIVIGVLSTVDAIYTGSEIFQSRGRGATLYLGDTGLKAGTGTDSSTLFGDVQIRNTATLIGAGSGLQNGASASDDTLVGDHTLTVDATNMKLRLDGGTAVSFVKGDTDIRVTAPSGAVIHLDSTAFVDGFSGDIPVSGEGTLSIDDGATSIPIDFSENQTLVNSITGAVTYVDTQGLVKAGDVHAEYQETSDIFGALIQLRDDILNRRGLSNSEWQAAMQRRVGDVQRVHDQLLEKVGEQSVSLDNLEGIEARAEIYGLETQRAVSERESADIASAIVSMQNEQNMLQFTYAVTSNVMAISILDYLR